MPHCSLCNIVDSLPDKGDLFCVFSLFWEDGEMEKVVLCGIFSSRQLAESYIAYHYKFERFENESFVIVPASVDVDMSFSTPRVINRYEEFDEYSYESYKNKYGEPTINSSFWRQLKLE